MHFVAMWCKWTVFCGFRAVVVCEGFYSLHAFQSLIVGHLPVRLCCFQYIVVVCGCFFVLRMCSFDWSPISSKSWFDSSQSRNRLILICSSQNVNKHHVLAFNCHTWSGTGNTSPWCLFTFWWGSDMACWHQGVRISNSLLASNHDLDETIFQSKLHILNTQKNTHNQNNSKTKHPNLAGKWPSAHGSNRIITLSPPNCHTSQLRELFCHGSTNTGFPLCECYKITTVPLFWHSTSDNSLRWTCICQ